MLLPLISYASAWDTDYKQIDGAVKRPVFPEKTFVISKYGAKPDGRPDKNQKAINKAIEACHKAGGGVVTVPAGTYRTGAIRLLSNVNLKVDEGATLLFVFQPELYPIVPTRWEWSRLLESLAVCICLPGRQCSHHRQGHYRRRSRQ